jgi:hypothetical protein
MGEASDAEREAVARRLRMQHVAGRLTLDELGSRIARAYAAQTPDELASLVADLPAPAAPQVSFQRRPDRFSVSLETDDPPADVLVAAVRELTAAGYRATDDEHVLVRRVRPVWTFVVAVLLFPVGLLALLVIRTRTVTLEVRELPGGGARLVAKGAGPRTLAARLASLAPR